MATQCSAATIKAKAATAHIVLSVLGKLADLGFAIAIAGALHEVPWERGVLVSASLKQILDDLHPKVSVHALEEKFRGERL